VVYFPDAGLSKRRQVAQVCELNTAPHAGPVRTKKGPS
jgi:hypothetical protein